jgi:hypothetical protein
MKISPLIFIMILLILASCQKSKKLELANVPQSDTTTSCMERPTIICATNNDTLGKYYSSSDFKQMMNNSKSIPGDKSKLDLYNDSVVVISDESSFAIYINNHFVGYAELMPTESPENINVTSFMLAQHDAICTKNALEYNSQYGYFFYIDAQGNRAVLYTDKNQMKVINIICTESAMSYFVKLTNLPFTL